MFEPETVAPGQELDYTVTVTNSGPAAATGITLSDPLDQRPDCTIDRRDANWPQAIIGTPGDDVICGSPSFDGIRAGDGDDIVFGLGGSEGIDGAAGNDRLYGGDGHDGLSGSSVRGMTAIARLSLTALDCPDPRALAEFYAAITGWEIDDDGDWVQLRSDTGATLAFQRAPHHRPPVWPSDDHPQQAHLDFDVPDLDAGEQQVLALGARKTEVQPGTSFRVYLDPAGHPFCLVLDQVAPGS